MPTCNLNMYKKQWIVWPLKRKVHLNNILNPTSCLKENATRLHDNDQLVNTV
jgi:hypothetical protein